MDICKLIIGSPLYVQALALRYVQFFQPHNLPREILIDEHENKSTHIAIVQDAALIAYGRVTDVGEDIYQLSQIVVSPEQQRKGYGSMILNELIKQAKIYGATQIILNARTTATALYTKAGFIESGEIFLSKHTGLPHIQMLYKLKYA